MAIFVGILTVVLVLDCAFLVLLVLLQLPKKEAGAGTAFGGGATDVLFGAGTGNVLTKATSYSAGIFLGLCLLLAILQNHMHKSQGQGLKNVLNTPVAGKVPSKTEAPVVPEVQLPVVPATTPVAPATGAGAAPVPATPTPAPTTGGSEPKK